MKCLLFIMGFVIKGVDLAKFLHFLKKLDLILFTERPKPRFIELNEGIRVVQGVLT